jgi:tetratricopeptide (TPR) repeat protein
MKLASLYLNIRVNGGAEAILFKGDYLRLTFTITSPELDEIQRENSLLDMDIEELDDAYKSGEVGAEEYSTRLAELKKNKKEIEAEEIGSKENPWFEAPDIQVSQTEGEYTSLSWKHIILTKNPLDEVLEVTPGVNASIDYLFRPGDLERVTEGAYALKVILNDGDSNEAVVEIRHADDPDPSEEKQGFNVRCLLMDAEYSKALKIIRSILKRNKESVQGLILMGVYHEATGDLSKALDSYQAARESWLRSNPDWREPPRIIDAKIALLSGMLRS